MHQVLASERTARPRVTSTAPTFIRQQSSSLSGCRNGTLERAACAGSTPTRLLHQLKVHSIMAASAQQLDLMAIRDVANQLNSLLLPEAAGSAESFQKLADKLKQLATHLKQVAEQPTSPANALCAPPGTSSTSAAVAQPLHVGPQMAHTAPVHKAEGKPTSRKQKRKLGALMKLPVQCCPWKPVATSCQHQHAWLSFAAAKPFLMEAYHQRYVALEVFYLGWQYHGFASQCGTDGTVEVPC